MPLRGPGYLDLARADAALRVAAQLWFVDNLALFEDGRPLPRPTVAATRVSLAADRSFTSWAEALAHVRAEPIAPGTELYWKQQHFDLLLQVPITSAQARFSLEPRFARMGLKVLTTLRFLPPGSDERAFEWHGNPGLVHLDPRWHQAALRFVEEGFWHILDGTDHLLFIAALVIPFRRLRPVVVMATAFTLAHSLTLGAAALGLAPHGNWFPPLVETLIAASIVWMALENLLGTSTRRRWMAAFGFGLVHGFGFAFALTETLQFAGQHLVTALAAFNLGVELGQLAVLMLLVPALNLLLRWLPPRGRHRGALGAGGAHRLALDGRALDGAAAVHAAADGRRGLGSVDALGHGRLGAGTGSVGCGQGGAAVDGGRLRHGGLRGPPMRFVPAYMVS